jgi:hypothetical protein
MTNRIVSLGLLVLASLCTYSRPASAAVRSTLLAIEELKSRNEVVRLHFGGAAPVYSVKRNPDGSYQLHFGEAIVSPTTSSRVSLKDGSTLSLKADESDVDVSLSALRLKAVQIIHAKSDIILNISDKRGAAAPLAMPGKLRLGLSSNIAPHVSSATFPGEATRLFALENHLGPGTATHHDLHPNVLSSHPATLVVNGQSVQTMEVDLIAYGTTVSINIPMSTVFSYYFDTHTAALLSTSDRPATASESAQYRLPPNTR